MKKRKVQERKFSSWINKFSRWSNEIYVIFSSFFTIRHCTVFFSLENLQDRKRENILFLWLIFCCFSSTFGFVKKWWKAPFMSKKRWADATWLINNFRNKKRKHRKTVIIASLFSLTLQCNNFLLNCDSANFWTNEKFEKLWKKKKHRKEKKLGVWWGWLRWWWGRKYFCKRAIMIWRNIKNLFNEILMAGNQWRWNVDDGEVGFGRNCEATFDASSFNAVAKKNNSKLICNFKSVERNKTFSDKSFSFLLLHVLFLLFRLFDGFFRT